jgi:hypothetical protein
VEAAGPVPLDAARNPVLQRQLASSSGG